MCVYRVNCYYSLSRKNGGEEVAGINGQPPWFLHSFCVDLAHWQTDMELFVDFQGFKDSQNEFIIKSLQSPQLTVPL